MPGRVCTGFKDSDGLDVGCHLVTKEFLIESFPQLLNQNKIPTLWVAGYGNFGCLGDNSTISKSSPVQTIAGGSNWRQVFGTTAIKTDGTLWTWGAGGGGALGDNTTVNKSSPVQTIAGGSNWRSLGGFTSAIKTDGTLWMWGSNGNGQLGDNTRGANLNRSSPVQVVGNATNWRMVSSSGTTAATKTDGTLWLWGSGFNGLLGNNSTASQSSPVQTIAGGTNWKEAVSTGFVSAAIKTDGTLWTWGCSEGGGIGDNNVSFVCVPAGQGTYAYYFNNRSSPVQTVAGGTNWKTVDGFIGRKCATSQYGGTLRALKTDGTLWSWGNNFYGYAGDNSTVNRSSPVQVVGSTTNWRVIGGFAAIKTDGSLWSIGGRGAFGKLGNNSTVNQSSPVQTIAGGTNWRNVNSGSSWFGAIRDLDAN